MTLGLIPMGVVRICVVVMVCMGVLPGTASDQQQEGEQARGAK